MSLVQRRLSGLEQHSSVQCGPGLESTRDQEQSTRIQCVPGLELEWATRDRDFSGLEKTTRDPCET